MAKRAKSKGVLDRISNLPDPILCHILSFLPGNDAVRTSILSSRWRYLFHSISTFDLCRYFSFVSKKNMTSFKNFVDRWFLYPSQISLESFRVSDGWVRHFGGYGYWNCDYLSLADDYLRLNGWICAALWRGVKEIDIGLERDSYVKLPTFLFTCQSLVTLKLDINRGVDVPANLCLPNLKTLHLTNIDFVTDDCLIHRLISSLPVLEDLAITTCVLVETRELNILSLSLKRLVLDFEDMIDKETYDFVVVINAPSLIYFKYHDVLSEGYTLSNMNSLEKADVRITEHLVDRKRGATQLLQGICNLPRRLLDERIAFHNLTELEFQHYHGERIWKGRWLVEFLHCVPNLNSLILQLAFPEGGSRVLPEEVPSCLSFHLKEITISHFAEGKLMLELVSYFLKNALVLEKLTLGIEYLSEITRLGILEKLLRLPKKSMKCQVVTC